MKIYTAAGYYQGFDEEIEAQDTKRCAYNTALYKVYQ